MCNKTLLNRGTPTFRCDCGDIQCAHQPELSGRHTYRSRQRHQKGVSGMCTCLCTRACAACMCACSYSCARAWRARARARVIVCVFVYTGVCARACACILVLCVCVAQKSYSLIQVSLYSFSIFLESKNAKWQGILRASALASHCCGWITSMLDHASGT